nr:hypothetical protein BaRGS_003655 [Batillaria attramentaria]
MVVAAAVVATVHCIAYCWTAGQHCSAESWSHLTAVGQVLVHFGGEERKTGVKNLGLRLMHPVCQKQHYERDKDSVEDSKLLLWAPPWAEIGENSALEGAGAEEEICDTGTVLPTGLKAELGEPRLRGPDPLLGVCGWYRWSQTSDSSVELANLLSPSKSLEYRKMEDCWTPNLRMTHGGWGSLSE